MWAAWLLACVLSALAGASARAGDDTEAVRVDYMLRCQGCHLPDGAGFPGKVPDLRHTMAPLLATAGGREFLVRVPGAASTILDDTRLAAVLNWMVAEFTPGGAPASFRPYTPDEVGRLRSEPLSDVLATREPLARAAGIAPAY